MPICTARFVSEGIENYLHRRYVCTSFYFQSPLGPATLVLEGYVAVIEILL